MFNFLRGNILHIASHSFVAVAFLTAGVFGKPMITNVLAQEDAGRPAESNPSPAPMPSPDSGNVSMPPVESNPSPAPLPSPDGGNVYNPTESNPSPAPLPSPDRVDVSNPSESNPSPAPLPNPDRGIRLNRVDRVSPEQPRINYDPNVEPWRSPDGGAGASNPSESNPSPAPMPSPNRGNNTWNPSESNPSPAPMPNPNQGSMNDQSGQGEGSDVRNEEQQKEWEEMEKKQEEERQKMEARQLKQMKSGLAGTKRGLVSLQKTFAKAKAKGASVPGDCEATLAESLSTVAAGEKAQTMDEMNELDIDGLRGALDELNDCRMTVDQILRVRQQLKAIDRSIKNLEKRWIRAKRSPPEGASEIVAEGNAILAKIKEARASLEPLLKEGKVEDVTDIMENEISGHFDDMDSAMRRLDAIRNANKFIKSFSSRIAQMKKMIAQMERKKQDTSSLQDILDQAEEAYAEIKGLKAGDEEFMDKLEEIMDLDREFSGEFRGDDDFGSKIFMPQSASDAKNQLKLEF